MYVPQNVNRKVHRTREVLSNSLIDLFDNNKDFESITVEDITSHSGVSRGTFYIHFETKGDLLSSILDIKLNEITDILSKCQLDPKISWEKQSDVLMPLLTYIKENSSFFNVVFNEKKIVGVRKKLAQTFRDSLNDDSNSSSSTIDNSFLISVAGATFGVVIHWINKKMQPAPTYISEEFAKLIYTKPYQFFFETSELSDGKPPMKLEKKVIDPRVLRTRGALKDSLMMLLIKKEYAAITVTEITKHADYNRVTFYSHYKDKEQLYKDALDDLYNRMISAMRNPTAPLVNLFSFIFDNRNIFNLMNNYNRAPGLIEQMYNNIFDFFYNEFPKEQIGIEIDKSIYSHFITTKLMLVIRDWVSTHMKYSPLYMAELTSKTFIKTQEDLPFATQANLLR